MIPRTWWTPKHITWWYRWWMYPPQHLRRFVGSGDSWELRAWYWLAHQKRRLTPGQCTECGVKRGQHKMRCSALGPGQVRLYMTWRRP